MSIIGTITANVLKISTRKKLQTIYDALDHPEQSVEVGLRKVLQFGKDSVYGRKYNFTHILEADTAEELYKRYSELPIISYSDLDEYIEKSVNGESDILFEGRPIMYMLTSGTTSKPKLLPVTEHYTRLIKDVTNMMLVQHLKIGGNFFNGKIFVITGKARDNQTSDGLWIGSVSGYNRETASKVVQNTYATPAEIFDVPDYNARYYLLMRFAVEQDVRYFITANPTTVIELIENAKLNFDKYCDDIEKGSINKELNMPEEIRKVLESKVKPNPKRAAKLRKLKEKKNEPMPKDYWPNMNVLCTWKCANTAFYVEKFQNCFPKSMKHMEFGYYSSECRFGFPFDGSNFSTVFPNEYYLEFIREEEYGQPGAKTYRIHELDEGRNYRVIVSTCAGLYRYDMMDIVIAGPKNRNTPTIQFLQKSAGIVSMTGEKISEQQFDMAVHKAAEITGKVINFFLGFAEIEKLRYDIYVEFEDGNLPEKNRQIFADEIDKQLYNMNVEYATKRDSLRLNKPFIYCLPQNALTKYKKVLLNSGKAKDNQFKIMTLNQNDELKAVIDDLTLN